MTNAARGARWTMAGAALALALALPVAQPATEQLPDAETFLRDLGFSADQIAQVKSGSFVEGTIQASNERELVAALAFLVQTSPTELVNRMRQDVLDRLDPHTIAFGMIEGTPSLASFAKLTLQPDAEKRTKAYADSGPDGDLNLSAEEIAAFDALGSAPAPAAVEAAVKSALMARLQAYQAQGLAGVAPYARSGGKTRSPADDLRSATTATKKLEALVPNAFQALLAYPSSKPSGFEEVFDWSHYQAHGVPTIALTHTLFIPEGPAWVVVQRQFYVSGGYNCEQSISAFLPMQHGTLVVYTNRTSTDQVTGFGGSAKRAIGSKLLASELEKLYGMLQAMEKPGGS
ncbi:MAG: hypothetical protein ACREVY_18155 [Gammaproteobacteria bacterium]